MCPAPGCQRVGKGIRKAKGFLFYLCWVKEAKPASSLGQISEQTLLRQNEDTERNEFSFPTEPKLVRFPELSFLDKEVQLSGSSESLLQQDSAPAPLPVMAPQPPLSLLPGRENPGGSSPAALKQRSALANVFRILGDHGSHVKTCLPESIECRAKSGVGGVV